MSVTAGSSNPKDTAVSAEVKNCGGNARLAMRRAWFASGFIEWVM